MSPARCRRNHNKTVVHKRRGGRTSLLCALVLLLSAIVLGACPDVNNGGNTPAEVRYTCENGTAVQGSTTDQDAQQNCMACDDGYALSGTQCLPGVQFMCANGVGATTLDMSATTTDTDCARCSDGYVLYTINGTKRQECASGTSGMLSNGVTIICPGVQVGGTFEIAGTTYTKRNKGDISTDNAARTCTTGITNMDFVFLSAGIFNDNIAHWDVSKVDDMNNMFNTASVFNQDIGHWDVSRVTNMNALFGTAIAFDQDIGNWDVGMVSNMSAMFTDAAMFNQDLSRWNVGMVSDMRSMFSNAALFNQDLSGWCVSSISSEPSSFRNGLLTTNTSPQWGTCP